MSDRDFELRQWCSVCRARCVAAPCLSGECSEMRPHRHYRCSASATECLMSSTSLVVLLRVEPKVQL